MGQGRTWTPTSGEEGGSVQHAGSHVNLTKKKKLFSAEKGAGASLLPPQGDSAHGSIPQALDGVQASWLGQMDTRTQGFLLCSCFSELQKASEQLELRHLTSMQQNKTNHAGSQLSLPVNHSNCTFIGSDGPLTGREELCLSPGAVSGLCFSPLVSSSSHNWSHTISSRPWH